MDRQAILEVKEKFSGECQRFPCELLSWAPDEVVVLYRLRHETRMDDLILPLDTLSFGYFWASRPYNAYHWVTPAGRTLGLYFNIGDRIRIAPDQVRWRDLVVDVLVTPDGRCRVLDEEELPADIEASLRQDIEATRDGLLRQHSVLQAEIESRSAAFFRRVGIH